MKITFKDKIDYIEYHPKNDSITWVGDIAHEFRRVITTKPQYRKYNNEMIFKIAKVVFDKLLNEEIEKQLKKL